MNNSPELNSPLAAQRVAERTLLMLPDEFRAEFAPFRQALLAEMLPGTELEQIYFESFCITQFSRLRMQAAESHCEVKVSQNPEDPEAFKRLLAMRRLLAGYEKRAKETFNIFNDLRANRILNRQLETEIAESTGESVNIPATTPTSTLILEKSLRMDRETTSAALYRTYREQPPTPQKQ
jgi:hypothetical protein